jgi:hypothetical protein
MKRILLIICLFPFLVTAAAFADTVSVDKFVVKENPFAENEIAIVATDSLGNIRESVNGIFSFTLNGFKQDMVFDKGTAFYRQKLDKSSFLYVKHINESGTHSVLYYIYKHSGKISPIRISWILLIAIPIGLILLGYIFKRFIIIAAIIFCIFLYFNHHNGLSIPTFFESIFDGLKGLF